MKTTRLFILPVIVCLTGFLPATLQALTWKLKVLPGEGGSITYAVSSPSDSGTTGDSQSLSVDNGANVDLTFTAQPGYRLVSVLKNGQEWIDFLDNADHFTFGPVSSSHLVVAIFELVSPEGVFSGTYDESQNGVTPIVDVTGNYSGSVPDSTTGRTYDVDLAMDESGKLMAMGTVTGITQTTKEGEESDLEGSVGRIRTVDDTPHAQLKGKLKGTKDGAPLTAKGKAAGDVEIIDSGGTDLVEGIASGVATEDGQKYVGKPTEGGIEAPASHSSGIQNAWGLTLTIAKSTDSKGREIVEASGRLRLPDGTYSNFPPKKVKYSAKKGYRVSFKKGAALDTSAQPIYAINPKTGEIKRDKSGDPIPLIDRKSRVQIKGLTFIEDSPDHFLPTGGEMKYHFLGQSGKADLVEFLD